MLASFFNRIRAKPEKEKKRIAFWCAAFLTAIIIIFWIFSFRAVYTEEKIPDSVPDNGPVSSLFQTMTDVIGDTVYIMKEAKDNFFSPSEAVYPDSVSAPKTAGN